MTLRQLLSQLNEIARNDVEMLEIDVIIPSHPEEEIYEETSGVTILRGNNIEILIH